MALQFEVYDRANNSQGDVTDIALEKSVTRRLNRPATARFKVPSELVPWLDVGNRCLKVRHNGQIYFNGIVWYIEDDGDQNTCYSEVLAVDPMVWWKSRYARDADGNLIQPTFLTDFITGPRIIQALVKHTAEFGEDGPIGMDYTAGIFEDGGSDLSGAPADWPAWIGDIATMLTDTGACDFVVNPVDDSDGYSPDIMGVLNGYNEYGSDLSGSISFDYDGGNNNVAHISRTLDFSTVANSLWYWFTPMITDMRYRGNITYPAQNPDGTTTSFQSALNAAILDSRAKYGKWQDSRVYDTSMDFLLRDLKWLYEGIWETESLIRLKPRELISITPVGGIDPTFNIGDQVGISAGPKLRGGFDTAKQRIYEFTINESPEGVTQLSELVASADQETS